MLPVVLLWYTGTINQGRFEMIRLSIVAAALVVAALFVAPLPAAAQAGTDEVAAVEAVIAAAYIKGIHIDRDVDAIRKGFHPAFTMFVYEDGKISTMSIDEWIKAIEEGKKKNPDPPKVITTFEFPVIEVSGNAAVARVELYKDGRHAFTDFMSLYKFADGWKIIGKIYCRY
jgi:hypothetical protein